MLPESLNATLQEHLRAVKIINEKDLADGWGRVQMPDALDRKYPNAPTEWRWQQELLGHTDVTTTMIYTHVLNKGGRGVRSPVDDL